MPAPSNQPVRHPLARLARVAVETWVRERTRIPVALHLPEDQRTPAGVFVTITHQNDLRGSVGTLIPQQPSLTAEVIENAIAAASEDPRFTPLQAAELPDLNYIVDVVEQIEDIYNFGDLDPACYGVAVRAGRRWGVVLPNIEGVDSIDQQLELAAHKAGVARNGIELIQRFRVRRLV